MRKIKAMPCNELAVRQWLGKHHPYDTPEIMCLNAGASGKYIEWMRDNACKDKPTQ
ncbi:MAG: divalent cation tolerance protein CutA [Mariprofundus sp.]